MKLNFRLNMGGEDLVIAIAQDWQTNDVLMVAFMNKEAVEQTLKTKKAHYYSTSRQKQWLKGESSGNVQTVKEMYIDCDADALASAPVEGQEDSAELMNDEYEDEKEIYGFE